MNDMRPREYPPAGGGADFAARHALKFILLIGALSFFADFTYEGSPSILGPYLGSLGADAAVIGSAAVGILYDRSVYAAVAFCVLAQLAAVPIFGWVGHHYSPPRLS